MTERREADRLPQRSVGGDVLPSISRGQAGSALFSSYMQRTCMGWCSLPQPLTSLPLFSVINDRSLITARAVKLQQFAYSETQEKERVKEQITTREGSVRKPRKKPRAQNSSKHQADNRSSVYYRLIYSGTCCRIVCWLGKLDFRMRVGWGDSSARRKGQTLQNEKGENIVLS